MPAQAAESQKAAGVGRLAVFARICSISVVARRSFELAFVQRKTTGAARLVALMRNSGQQDGDSREAASTSDAQESRRVVQVVPNVAVRPRRQTIQTRDFRLSAQDAQPCVNNSFATSSRFQ